MLLNTMESKPKPRKAKTNWFCYNSNYYKSISSGDEDEVEQKKTREFMSKYMANYRAHRKGMTPEEIADYYSHWAETQQYDSDLEPGIYNGPTIVAEEIAECFPEKRDKVRIIDIACGTGRVGEELSQYGFKTIDGVDPAGGMLKQCLKKNIYKNLYKEFVGDKPLSIEDGIYDCAVCSGGFGEGHIPCSGLQEMSRIVKTGGLIIFVMRKEYIKYVEEYADKLEPMISRLEHEHTWELLERREVANYSFNRDGVLFKLRIKRSGPAMDNAPSKTDSTVTNTASTAKVGTKTAKEDNKTS